MIAIAASVFLALQGAAGGDAPVCESLDFWNGRSGQSYRSAVRLAAPGSEDPEAGPAADAVGSSVAQAPPSSVAPSSVAPGPRPAPAPVQPESETLSFLAVADIFVPGDQYGRRSAGTFVDVAFRKVTGEGGLAVDEERARAVVSIYGAEEVERAEPFGSCAAAVCSAPTVFHEAFPMRVRIASDTADVGLVDFYRRIAIRRDLPQHVEYEARATLADGASFFAAPGSASISYRTIFGDEGVVGEVSKRELADVYAEVLKKKDELIGRYFEGGCRLLGGGVLPPVGPSPSAPPSAAASAPAADGALPSSSPAPGDAVAPVPAPSGEIRPATLVFRVEPAFPARCASRNARAVNDVVVAYDVDEAGVVRNLTVVRSDDPCFEASVLAAVARWRYAPRLEDGEPVVETGLRETFTFELSD